MNRLELIKELIKHNYHLSTTNVKLLLENVNKTLLIEDKKPFESFSMRLNNVLIGQFWSMFNTFLYTYVDGMRIKEFKFSSSYTHEQLIDIAKIIANDKQITSS